MSYLIEVPAATDFDRLTEVWEAAVRATHDFLTEDDVAFFRPLVRDTYLGLVQLTCLRDDAGAIIAFAGVADGKLEMLFVHPAWHGRGAGKRLLEHARDVQGALLVDVNEDNPRATEFYRRMGYEVYDRSPLDSLGKPYPLLHMRYRAHDND